MQRTNSILKLLVASLTIAALVGCSKPSSEEAPQPSSKPELAKTASPPRTQSVTKVKTPSRRSSSATSSVDGVLTAPPMPEAEGPQDTLETLQEIANLELAYVTNTEFSARAEVIYKISDVGTPGAIPALGRVFSMESDPELKTEVLSLLADIDNQDEQKIAILSVAVGADQPKEVREAAIDAITDLGSPQRGLLILQSLANDPDSEIRDDVKDAIEQVHAVMSETR